MNTLKLSQSEEAVLVHHSVGTAAAPGSDRPPAPGSCLGEEGQVKRLFFPHTFFRIYVILYNILEK